MSLPSYALHLRTLAEKQTVAARLIELIMPMQECGNDFEKLGAFLAKTIYKEIKASREGVERLIADLELCLEAMRDSISRSDDVADSWCSRPIRLALQKIREEK